MRVITPKVKQQKQSHRDDTARLTGWLSDQVLHTSQNKTLNPIATRKIQIHVSAKLYIISGWVIPLIITSGLFVKYMKDRC